ncbi:MAG: hypothetical protein AB8H03_26365 [Saprospiraceae bacterium]
MSNKNFDKKLKEGLQDYESELDVNSFWASIESDVDEINKEEKKRRILPFLLFFLLVGVSVSILLSIDFVEENGKPIVVNTVEELVESNLENNTQEEIKHENKTTIFNNKAIETKSIQNGFGEKDDLIITENLSKSSFFSKNNLVQKSYLLENKAMDEEPILENFEKPKEEILIKNKIEISESYNSISNTFASISSPFFLLKNRYSILSLDDVKKHVTYKNEKIDSSQFKIEIQSGFHFVNRLLENEDLDNQALFDLRNKTESMRGAFNFAVLGSWKPKPYLSISTGLNFTQINEQFKFQGEIIQSDSTVNEILAFQINVNEDSVAIFGDQVYDRKFSHNKLYFNKFRMIDIPVLIGFEKRIKDFSIGGRAGVFINLSLKTSGLIFQTTETFVDLGSNQDQVFKSNIGLSYYFGGVIKYHLNNKLAISVQPSFRFFPHDFSHNNTFTSQKYNLIGLNLGFEYGF